jgi:5-azacytidine-induced protein 1
VRHAKETEKEMKKRLDVQKEEYEEAVKRHLSFIDQLIDDKKTLTDKYEAVVKEMKTSERKYQDKVKAMQDRSVMIVNELGLKVRQ